MCGSWASLASTLLSALMVVCGHFSLQNDPSTRDLIEDSLSDIQLQYFNRSSHIILFANDSNEYFPSLLKKMTMPRTLFNIGSKMLCSQMVNWLTDLIIVLVKDISNLETVLLKLPREPEISIVLVIAAPNASTLLQTSVHSLADFQFVNVVILMSESRDTVTAYSYSPYPACECRIASCGCSASSDAFVVAEWSEREGWGKGSVLFPRNQHLNLNKQKITFGRDNMPWSVMDLSGSSDNQTYGFAVSILNVVSSRLNFTYTFQKPKDGKSWGWVYPNGSAIGVFGDMIHGRTNASIGEFFFVTERYKFIDFGKCFRQGCLTWIVPSRSGAYQSKLKLALFEFRTEVWVLMSSTPVIVSVFVYAMTKMGGAPAHSRISRSYWHTVAYTYSVVFSMPLPKIHLEGSLKCFYSFWYLFALITSAYYTGVMVHFLKEGFHQQEVRTVHEIVYRGFNITTHINYIKVLGKMAAFDKTMKPVLAATRVQSNSTLSFDEVAVYRNSASLQYLDAIQYFLPLYNNRTVSRIYVIPRSCIRIQVAPYIFRKGSVLRRHFDRITTRLLEAGFIDVWYTSYFDPIYLLPKGPKPLTLRTLEGAFVFMGVGFSIAVTILLFELAFD